MSTTSTAATPATRGGQIATAANSEAIRNALKNSLYPGASDASVDMVLSYCQAAGLDPMTKPVHIVPMNVKKPGTRDQYEWRDVVLPGIELYRTKAHRTGEYAGQDEAEFGPTISETLDRTDVRYPEWCRVTVYKIVQGHRVAYTAKVYWLESYATASRNSDAPNSMWKKRPFGQLEKCAEAAALRKAFPEAVGAQPTAEEMYGKVIDSTSEVDNSKPAFSERQIGNDATAQNNAAASDDAGDQEQPKAGEPERNQQGGGTPATASQIRLILKRADGKGVGEAALLKQFGLNVIDELPQDKVNAAMDWIKAQNNG